jgi:CBS domain-containing protein
MTAVSALMIKDMVTMRPDRPVKEAVDLLSKNRIGAVLIVDGGKLTGLFSERDLLQRVVAKGRDLDVLVSSVATSPVVTVDINAPAREVVQAFRDGRFRHLPVVDQGRPVGILSTRDFLAHVVEGLERFINDAGYRRELSEGVDPYDHLGGSYGK